MYHKILNLRYLFKKTMSDQTSPNEMQRLFVFILHSCVSLENINSDIGLK